MHAIRDALLHSVTRLKLNYGISQTLTVLRLDTGQWVALDLSVAVAGAEIGALLLLLTSSFPIDGGGAPVDALVLAAATWHRQHQTVPLQVATCHGLC